MSIPRLVAMSLCATLLFLAGLEGILRLSFPLDDLLFSYERAGQLVVIADDGGIFSRLNSKVDNPDGDFPIAYEINGRGLRESREIPLKAEEDTHRILALGDSWIFGVGANQGQDITGQLERLLEGRWPGKKVEVINAGVMGRCAHDMLRSWRQLGFQYALDGVLLGQPHNQFRQSQLADERAAWYSSVRGAPRFNSHIYLGLRRLIAPHTRPQYQVTAQGEEPSTLEDLANIARGAKAMGLPVYMTLLPNNLAQIQDGGRPNTQIWVDALAKEGVKFTGHGLQQRSCWGFYDLQHPSEAGYRVLAENLAELIASGQEPTSLKVGQVPVLPNCDGVDAIGPGKPGVPYAFEAKAKRGPMLPN